MRPKISESAEAHTVRRANAKAFNEQLRVLVGNLIRPYVSSFYEGDVVVARGVLELREPDVLHQKTEFIFEVRHAFQRPEKIAKVVQKHFGKNTKVFYAPIVNVTSLPSGNIYAEGWVYSVTLNDIYLD